METPEDQWPVVLLIGTVDREGVISALKSSGQLYAVKRIDSTPENWKTICARFAESKIACALLKLTPTTYHHLASDTYADVRDVLLAQLVKTRHAIYVYEDLFSGRASNADHSQPSSEDFYGEYFSQPDDSVRLFVNALLAERGLEVVPYRNNAELTVLASKFIADADQGLLFRVYLPADRIWAHETDRLLTLFRDYLCKVGHENITLNQTRTAHGVVYEFFAAQGLQHTDYSDARGLSTQFADFSLLLDLCLNDADGAGKMLEAHGVSVQEISALLTRYSKEAKRLQVDLRHEREQKVLSIRHRLEAELVDELPVQVTSEAIGQLVDAAVPPIAGLGKVLMSDAQPLQLTAAQGASIVVNLRPQTINSVNGIVAQEVNGGVHLSNEDHRILQLIQEHAPDRALELTSAVRQVADDSVKTPDRILSARRLKAFLIQLGAKLPDIGAGLLQAYLEKRLGL